MAQKGWFDPLLLNAEWFSLNNDLKQWFDSTLLDPAASGGTNYSLTASAGSYSLTGVTAQLKVGRKITANAGSYTLTGGTASLSVGRKVSASAGAYSLSGNTAVLKVGRRITANAGSYAYSGSNATLTKFSGPIAYSLTGTAGTYSLSGGTASLKVARKLTANAGAYSLVGSQATLTYTPSTPVQRIKYYDIYLGWQTITKPPKVYPDVPYVSKYWNGTTWQLL